MPSLNSRKPCESSVPLPTCHGQLRITVLSDQVTKLHFGADVGVYYAAQGSNWLICSLESINGRRLVNSVAGIGNDAPPFE